MHACADEREDRRLRPQRMKESAKIPGIDVLFVDEPVALTAQAISGVGCGFSRRGPRNTRGVAAHRQARVIVRRFVESERCPLNVHPESTDKIVELKTPSGSCRHASGKATTEAGIACHAFITRIAVSRTSTPAEFEREHQEHRPPSPEIINNAYDLRLVISTAPPHCERSIGDVGTAR